MTYLFLERLKNHYILLNQFFTIFKPKKFVPIGLIMSCTCSADDKY